MAEDTSGKSKTTSFFLFETTNGATWEYVGKVDARDRDHAARLFYANVGSKEIRYVAVSETAWHPKVRKPKVVENVTLEDFIMPGIVMADPDPDPVPVS